MKSKVLIVVALLSSFWSLGQSYITEGDSLVIFEEAFGSNGFGCCAYIPDGKVIAYFNSNLPLTEKVKYMEGYFIENNFSGPWKFYHENGKVKSEGEFLLDDNVTLDLIACEDLDTGNVEFIELKRKKSHKDGVWRYYNKNGELEKEVIYRQGEIVK